MTRHTQGSNLFWFDGQGAPKPRGLVALEGAVVSCRTVVNRTGEKPHALTIELSPDALEASSRQHLTIAAISEELQVGVWVTPLWAGVGVVVWALFFLPCGVGGCGVLHNGMGLAAISEELQVGVLGMWSRV